MDDMSLKQTPNINQFGTSCMNINNSILNTNNQSNPSPNSDKKQTITTEII